MGGLQSLKTCYLRTHTGRVKMIGTRSRNANPKEMVNNLSPVPASAIPRHDNDSCSSFSHHATPFLPTLAAVSECSTIFARSTRPALSNAFFTPLGSLSAIASKSGEEPSSTARIIV